MSIWWQQKNEQSNDYDIVNHPRQTETPVLVSKIHLLTQFLEVLKVTRNFYHCIGRPAGRWKTHLRAYFKGLKAQGLQLCHYLASAAVLESTRSLDALIVDLMNTIHFVL